MVKAAEIQPHPLNWRTHPEAQTQAMQAALEEIGFAGAVIASEQLGRKCRGIEISPHYCDVIVTRWEKFTGKKATLEKRPHA